RHARERLQSQSKHAARLDRKRNARARCARASMAGQEAQSDDLLIQLALLVALCHCFETDRLDLGSVASRTELLVTRLADRLHGLRSRGQPLARIELLAIVVEELAHRTGSGHAQVGVD